MNRRDFSKSILGVISVLGGLNASVSTNAPNFVDIKDLDTNGSYLLSGEVGSYKNINFIRVKK